jgi:hypothetical protein
MMPIFENGRPQMLLLPAWRQRVRLLLVMLCLTGCSIMATSAQDTGLPAPEVHSTDPPVQTSEVKPALVPGEVREIDEDQHIVGGITFRKSTREISFDAQLNQAGGPIEFLLVTEKGKIHESLFSCSISPTDLNLAFKLLGYPTSPELFEIIAPDHRPTGKYPEVPEDVRSGARLAIFASWQDEGSEKTCAVNDLVKNSATGDGMPLEPWLYTGSLITKAGFRAETTGDIIAVFSNPSAMINYPGKERTNDEVWSVSQIKLPSIGTTVRITIRSFSKITEPNKKVSSP